MKDILCLFVAAALFCGCSEVPSEKPSDEKPEPVEWRGTYNGNLLLGMASAYDTWNETGKLATAIKWDGVNVFNSEFLRAGLSLMVKMLDEPDSWMEDDLEYPSASVAFVTDDPFLPREVPFEVFLKAVRKEYEAMYADGAVDKRFKVEPYESVITASALNVMLCRAFAYYRDNGCFPETIDTWDASYVRATKMCQVDAPEVKAARDAAWKAAGVTESSTARQKAVAIFNYARDEWEYEDYYNTSKGAVGTIKAKAGNCCDMSHAICAMARLSGIPARYFHAQCQYSSGVIGHVVSQLMIDDVWYMADATNNANEFGKVRFTTYTNDELLEELQW